MKIDIGSKIRFEREKQKYTVQASNEYFAICTKPFNPKKTVLYTIIDWREDIRGAENLIFCMGAETREKCEQCFKELWGPNPTLIVTGDKTGGKW